MTFHLKTYPDALRQLFVSSSVEETNTAFDQAIVTLQKSYTMAGYRKGKVPTDIIAKANPPELMNIVSDLLMKGAYDYIDAQNTPLYGQPRFNPMSGLSKDKEFLFSLVYEIYPSITNKVDLSKEKFDYIACEIEDKFVEDTMCRQLQLFQTVTGTIQDFDLVNIEILNSNYKGDTKTSSLDSAKLELLVGKKTDETISIAFDDLSGYLPEFIGKVSNPLEIKLVDILRAKDWATLTDKDIEEKTPFKTKNEYKEQSLKQFENAMNSYNDSKKAEALSEKIGTLLKAEIPKSLWLNNVRDLALKTAEKDVIREEKSLDSLKDNKDLSKKFQNIPTDAIGGLAFIIWLEEFAQKENITVEEQELEYHYYRYAQSNRLPMSDYKKHISAENRESIKGDALREKAMGHLLTTLNFNISSTIPLSEALKSFNRQ